MKRLISANPSEILNMTAQELKQSIQGELFYPKMLSFVKPLSEILPMLRLQELLVQI